MTKTKAVDRFLESGNASQFARDLGCDNQGGGSSKMIRALREYIIKNV